ncbi:anaphase-promoting complex subunit 15B [Daktulosphaira vitifoliae]|uniref:anaphase-promoting complex subunit 15B n=1 Tax=Daktulosphaira vitifoliae TaxID=58002 RepID=UPI0021AA82CB|nr:anaphase-promoting complex subunit 15B [Daktulosphaira vitifoliae]
MNPNFPIFPTMTPNIVDPLWFSVDKPKNEDAELIQIESAHQNWLLTVVNKINDKDVPLPIGKTATEIQEEEDEEDEEEEVNASDDSETHDEEEDDVEMDGNNTYDPDSSVSTR